MLTVNRKQLLRAVQLAATISQKWSGAKPILQGLLIRADGNLSLKSTDLERQLTSHVEHNGGGTLEALPSTERLLHVLQNEDSEEITLDKSDDNLIIRSTTGEYELPDCDRPDVFPTFDIPSEDEPIIIKREELLSAIQEVRHASLEGESLRYALGGINFEKCDGKLTLVATDGKQLSHAHIKVDGLKAKSASYVVPNKAIGTLVSLLNGATAELVNLELTPQSAVFTVDGDVLLARLVDGRYPTWREVIRPGLAVSIPVPVGELSKMVRRAQTMTTEDSHAVKLSFDSHSFTTEASGAGKAKIKFPASYDITPFSVRIDPAMLLDGLRVLPQDSDVTLSVSGKAPDYSLLRLSHEAYAGHESIIVPLTGKEAS